MDVQTISVRLPVDLYEKLRLTAFERRESMNSLVVEGAELRLAQTDDGRVLAVLRHALDLSLQLDRTAAQKRRIVDVQNRLTSWLAFLACENGRPAVIELREAIGDAADRNVEAALSEWEAAK